MTALFNLCTEYGRLFDQATSKTYGSDSNHRSLAVQKPQKELSTSI